MAWDMDVKTQSRGRLPKVAICLPHRGALSMEFMEHTWGPLRFVPVPWCVKLPLICEAPSLPLARNAIVEDALRSGVDYLFWIDDDMVFESPPDPNEALQKLMACNVPIVSGLYRAKKREGFHYAAWMRSGDGYVPVEGWSEGANWIEVDAIGFGCCLIRADVFQRVPKPWFHWESAEEASEDFYFCEKAKATGYAIGVFTDVRLSHIGVLKVKSSGQVTTPPG